MNRPPGDSLAVSYSAATRIALLRPRRTLLFEIWKPASHQVTVDPQDFGELARRKSWVFFKRFREPVFLRLDSILEDGILGRRMRGVGIRSPGEFLRWRF